MVWYHEFTMEKKKRLLTGLQPSGNLHIGNYFGALKPFVDSYPDYDSFLMVADYHSLTSQKDREALRENTLNIVKDYLAAGVDPKKMTLFKQSDVPEHTELAWIFECLVTVPFLSQAHAYKDKVAKGIEATAGLFNYPMLMAADILLYDTDVVPVGEDQRQHIEYAREAAVKFNNAFGSTFVEPAEAILKTVGIVPGTDGTKMSKSYKNTIPLFGTKDEIAKAVMSIVTGTVLPPSSVESEYYPGKNILEIHKLFKPTEEKLSMYNISEKNYKNLKEMLIEDIETYFAPFRARRKEISDDDVRAVLAEGSKKAHSHAQEKMSDVRNKIGLTI